MYKGPDPQDIDINYPIHTYELITCLVNGEQKRIIQDRYLLKYGISKVEYLIKFPEAPLKSLAASESYSRAASTEEGRKRRSETITNLNLNSVDFQEKRKKASKDFLESDRSNEYRRIKSEMAKKQHKETDLEDHIRKYYKERHPGSDAQKQASIRSTLYNPGSLPEAREKGRQTYIRNSEMGLHNKETKFKKKLYKETSLMYQSSYELDFLELCDNKEVLARVKNAPCFSAIDYPYNFYAPDYILDDIYVIEIKSWYIENLQEKRCPGIIKKKEALVISKGYKFLYIKDKDYNELLKVFSFNVPTIKL